MTEIMMSTRNWDDPVPSAVWPTTNNCTIKSASRFSAVQTHTPAPAPGKWTGGELQDGSAASGRIKTLTGDGLRQRQPEPEEKRKTFASPSPCLTQAGGIISCYATFTEGVAARRRHRDLTEADGESACEHDSHVSSVGLIRPRKFTVR
ncbi:hypothetical protein fugu_019320 [Takifugu bimaculatus]|uniref:Uncharacterized protein n=1 Tax=Takifugu bimaculatus TaxID=433685 RepID=A0A4Z2BKV5_9TELE|nr:hypothetical protein fugu_019320 [Takifugu bimaculatus]